MERWLEQWGQRGATMGLTTGEEANRCGRCVFGVGNSVWSLQKGKWESSRHWWVTKNRAVWLTWKARFVTENVENQDVFGICFYFIFIIIYTEMVALVALRIDSPSRSALDPSSCPPSDPRKENFHCLSVGFLDGICLWFWVERGILICFKSGPVNPLTRKPKDCLST